MTHWTLFLATEAAEAATEGGGLFDLDATLPLMAIQFLLLVAILNAVFFKPLGKVLDERSEYVRNQVGQAKERQEKAKLLASQYEQELREVRRKSQEIIADAQAEAEKIVSSEVKKAQAEVLAKKAQAAQTIEQEKARALESLEQQVDALSNQVVEKILGRTLA